MRNSKLVATLAAIPLLLSPLVANATESAQSDATADLFIAPEKVTPELTAHLGYEAGAEPPAEQTNRRNGVATKRVKGSDGEVPLSVPRDR